VGELHADIQDEQRASNKRLRDNLLAHQDDLAKATAELRAQNQLSVSFSRISIHQHTALGQHQQHLNCITQHAFSFRRCKS
jgi:hypothetical protein